jgi:hypothetical protein
MSFWEKLSSLFENSDDLSEKEWALKMYSPGLANHDYYALPFNEYLLKHCANPDLTAWARWQDKFIEPAFDNTRHDELAKRFEYKKNEVHDFNLQAEVYDSLKSNALLDEETRKFIGFLGGVGFFKSYEISPEEWLFAADWYNPFKKEPQRYPKEEQCTISELLALENGPGYFKTVLTGIPFLNRGGMSGSSSLI